MFSEMNMSNAHTRRKIEQVRLSVWQRVGEHEDAMQSLSAKRASLDARYARRIRQVLSGEDGAAGAATTGAKYIEDVVKEERARLGTADSSLHNGSSPSGKKNGGGDQSLLMHHRAHHLTAAMPSDGIGRADLVAKLEMERSRVHDDISREIASLAAAHEQERAAIHSAAEEILRAVSKVRHPKASFFAQERVSPTARTTFPRPLIATGPPFPEGLCVQDVAQKGTPNQAAPPAGPRGRRCGRWRRGKP